MPRLVWDLVTHLGLPVGAVGGVGVLAVDAAAALHGEGGGGGLVEGIELFRSEDLGKQHDPDGDQGHDEDGEANGGNCLCDGKGGGEAEDLDADEPPDGFSPLNIQERVVRRREASITPEEDEFCRDAIGSKGLDAHDKEEASQDAVRNEMEAGKQGARHCAKSEETLSQVGEALLDHVRGFKPVPAFMFTLLVDFLDWLRNAE